MTDPSEATLISKSEAGHRLDGLVSDFMDGRWTAECQCGWAGPPKHDIGDAEKTHKAHVQEAVNG